MRTLNLMLALIAGIGWAAAAQGGTIAQTYSIRTVHGSTWKKVEHGNFSSSYTSSGNVTGTIMGAFTTANSTFAKSDIPPASVWLHTAGGSIQATGSRMEPLLGRWTTTWTVTAKPQGSASCHVGASGMIAASCSAAFVVTSKAHCTGGHSFLSGSGCTLGNVPGCFTGASDMHTNMWSRSIHLGAASFTHRTGSTHYLKSFQAWLVPPKGHTCSSASPSHMPNSNSGGHLASSNLGYHTFHMVGKLLSTP